MSNGTPHRLSSSMEPHATISAQNMVENHPDRYGFLRKRGQKERLLENLHLSRHINWRQRFVAIKDGSCYCFKDELSKAPLQTFSLQGYNRVSRATSERATFVFNLESDNVSRKKIHTFAASTDDERLAWMQKFRDAMCTANDVEPTPVRSSLTDPQDLFSEVEKFVYVPANSRQPRESDSRGSDDEEDSEDDSDYDCLDENFADALKEKTQRRTLPLPPVPRNQQSHGDEPFASTPSTRKQSLTLPSPKSPSSGDSGDGWSSGGSGRPSEFRPRPPLPVPGSSGPRASSPPERSAISKPQPPVPVLPKAKPVVSKKPARRLSERDCFFDNSDREAAIEILRESNTPGTFMIRKSRQGDSKVLVVMTTEDVKEYKIFAEDNRFSLDKKSFFNTVDDLLDNYSKSPLPNRQQTLTRSYR